ncbi:hypothetical protein [Tolypothrix sp. VBCCA 56010]
MESGEWGIKIITNSQCPMPIAQCPIPYAQKNVTFIYHNIY